ncbi:hypothetical protein O0I10_009653 [Lichtheimia ornata]|uniref:Uncharacterized protein n=1 Tax=Lichtheimia ornata TaxID=688661 RepID=A0AAD7UWM2_9FUNG|nr:uncharacterized protein O0I10_009653 [Lichtheimia ornata]KAJ8654762.1 hypothetical protein O0I10_009653 [Lichtheimia ornata]
MQYIVARNSSSCLLNNKVTWIWQQQVTTLLYNVKMTYLAEIGSIRYRDASHCSQQSTRPFAVYQGHDDMAEAGNNVALQCKIMIPRSNQLYSPFAMHYHRGQKSTQPLAYTNDTTIW